jgi:hypothetical protein
MTTFAVVLTLAAAASSPEVEKRPEPLQDNSFLVEEAYNQEPGVIQHIMTWHRTGAGEWNLTFTDEWPVPGQTHQLSATVAYARGGGEGGFGDVLVNYRWQAVGSGETAVAVAPRVSLVVPAGAGARGFGSGGWGAQVTLPVSSVMGEHFVSHTNLGATWIPSASTPEGRGATTGVNFGQGLVWLLHPRLNPMFEAVYGLAETVLDGAGTVTRQTLLLAPGIRGGVDVGSLQIVAGAAAPIGIGPSSGERGVFLYLSFEHPLWSGGEAEKR